MAEEFKKGDIVLIVHSYGGGMPCVGTIGTFGYYTEQPHALKNDCPHMVETEGGGAIFCRAEAPTPLLKGVAMKKLKSSGIKVGDVFIYTRDKSQQGPYVITAVTNNKIFYVVNEQELERETPIWKGWIRDGDMVPATELMKALL